MADQTDEAARAAGQAAKDRAAKSHWPPTQGDVEAIGGAAGAAAGAVFGGPAGAALGGVIGTAVGSGVYLLADAIAHGLNAGYNPGAEYQVALRNTGHDYATAIERLVTSCRSDTDAEVAALKNWGWQLDDSTGAWRQKAVRYGAPAAMQALDQNRREFFRAYAARSAECETYNATRKHPGLKEPPKRGAGIGTVVVAAAGIGGVLWLVSLL